MIEDFNPWWSSREGVEEVEIYRRYAESEVRWRSDLIDRLSLSLARASAWGQTPLPVRRRSR